MEIQNNDRIKQLSVRYVKGETSERNMKSCSVTWFPWNDWRVEFVVS